MKTNSVTSEISKPSGVNAAAAESPLVPMAAVATISQSTLDPAKGVETATGANLSDPSLPVAVSLSPLDFEVEIAALEAEWLRDGISMNATAFFLAVFNNSADNSKSSVAVSE